MQLICLASIALCSTIIINASSISFLEYNESYSKQQEWLSMGQRMENRLAYPMLHAIDVDTVEKLFLSLYCSTKTRSFHADTGYRSCPGFHLVDNSEASLIVHADVNNRKLYFGHAFSLDADENVMRSFVYERAPVIFNALKEVLEKHSEFKDFEQFHVGYGSGASMAILMSNALLSTPLINTSTNNIFNQVKLLTFNPVPMFLANTADMVGDFNQFHILRNVNLQSNSPYTLHGKVLEIKKILKINGKNSLNRNEILSYLIKNDFDAALTSKISLDILTPQLVCRYLGKKRFDELFDMDALFWGPIKERAAKDVAERFQSYIPKVFNLPFHNITCGSADILGSPNDSSYFQVDCVFELGRQKPLPLGAFHAKFTSYSDRAQASAQLNVMRSSEPTPFDLCISDLVEASGESSLLSRTFSDSSFFIADKVLMESGRFGLGNVFHSIDGTSILGNLFDMEPKLIHTLFPPNTQFPRSCSGIIVAERKPAHSLASTSSKYLMKMNVVGDDQEIDAQLPSYLHSKNVEGFDTTEILVSDIFVSNDAVFEHAIECLNDKNTVFVNCSLDFNKWIPGACPAFCANGSNLKICENVSFCPAISAYIALESSNKTIKSIKESCASSSFSRSGVSSLFAKVMNVFSSTNDNFNDILNALRTHPVAQYALYYYRPTDFSSKLFSNNYIGLFFNQVPDLDVIPAAVAINQENVEDEFLKQEAEEDSFPGEFLELSDSSTESRSGDVPIKSSVPPHYQENNKEKVSEKEYSKNSSSDDDAEESKSD